MSEPIYVGIDVSKARLDVAYHPHSKPLIVANDDAGIEELVRQLTGARPALVVMEATGGYEAAAAYQLAAADLPVALVNPRQVLDFAKSRNRLAKTDAIDAAILAEFGQANRPKPRPLPQQAAQELKALVTRRRQLIAHRVAESNRRETALTTSHPSIDRHIAFLDAEIEAIDDDLQRTIRSSPIWRAKEKLLRSVPGVGPATSAMLMGHLPELGATNRKEIAALAGLAPFNRDSGVYQGKRTCWGGRSSVRAVLYMATLTATRCNPDIRHFYLRLTNAGKAPKVALNACMRKLLTILNAIAKDGQPWQPRIQNNP